MGARILVVDDSPTIRKVVSAILDAHAYQPVTAEDGQRALEVLDGGEQVDLILLDFVMPRMNGYQFCRELRSKPSLKHLPVVLMSAKGDKIRGQFVQQTGAVDAITKPFDARGLVAVVEGALKRQEEGRARPVPEAAAMPDEDALESIRPSSVSVASDPAYQRARAVLEIGASLGKTLAQELIRLPEIPSSAEGAVSDSIQRALTTGALRELLPHLEAFVRGESSVSVLSGDTAVISIAEVLQLLHLQRQSGALSVTTRRSGITLYLREGQLDFASSHGLRDEFLLGRYLVEDGVLTREALLELVADTGEDRPLLGELVKGAGLATEAQLRHALVRQTSELVYEVVRWKHGRFAFMVSELSPAAERAALGLAPNALIMEGFRRVDEWRLIEGSFDFDEILLRDEVAIDRLASEAKLTKQERLLLDAIDGERTVREIVDELDLSSFEACKFLYQFLNSRLVRRKAA